MAVIDAALVCHVGFLQDGQPRVLPMVFARDGRRIVLHGARANAMLQSLLNTDSCCLAFTHVDGLVFARSAMHHSMNYRSVVAYGRAGLVEDAVEKRRLFDLLLEHMAPGRSIEARPPTDEELRATTVVCVHLEEAATKVRTGPAKDDPSDLALPTGSASVLPLSLRAGLAVTESSGGCPLSVREKATSLGIHVADGFAPVERRYDDWTLSSDSTRLDFEYVHAFLRDQSYWARGIDAPRLRRAMQHSVCFGLYRGDRQCGFCRGVTDTGRIAYLADVFIDPEHRGRGWGRRLVEFALAHPSLVGVEKVLLGTRDAHALYRGFGFEEVEAGLMMGLRLGSRTCTDSSGVSEPPEARNVGTIPDE